MKNQPLGRAVVALLSLAMIASACGSNTDASSSGNTDTTKASTESSAMDHKGGHGEPIEVSSDLPVPEVAVTVEPDKMKGQNLSVDLENFEVTPKNASSEPVDGEGHLHLFVDGKKVLRFYNTDVHLNLEPGSHEIAVEINANNHAPYAKDGEVIRSATTIEVEELPDDMDHHDKKTVDVSGTDPVPSIKVSVEKDPKSGWNVHAPVSDFTVTADNVNTPNVDGEGHLHLLVNGEKQVRLYGEWWHLDKLPEGDHEITVQMVGNDHAVLTDGDTPLEATADITVAATENTEMGDHDDHDGDKHDHHDDMKDDSHDSEGGGHHDHESSGSEYIEDGLTKSDAATTISSSYTDGKTDTEVDGKAVGASSKVKKDSVVAIEVTSDVDEQVHVHGYDLLVDVSADKPALIVFTADVPGEFEIEMETSAALVTKLQVS